MTSFDISSLCPATYVLAPEVLLTEHGPQRDHVIQVADGKIVAISDRKSFTEKNPNVSITRMSRHAVIPGFIDTHNHVGQTFGKSLIGGEPSQIWQRIWKPLEGALDTQGCYVAAKWMFLEALRGGFTTVVNYSLNTHEKNAAVASAAADTGIRLVAAIGLDTADGHERQGEQSSAAMLPQMIELLDQHIADCAKTPNIYPSFCCSGLYGSTSETLSAMAEHCAKRGVIFQMHSNEHFPEVHGCILSYGKRPIELWSALGMLGPHTLLHHATLVSEGEIELLRASRTAISYNPVASQWKGNGVAPALAYVARGVRMGLGTDATRMDAFRTLDAAESCQRIAHGLQVIDFSCGAAWTWIEAGTKGAADACGLGSITGSLAQGKSADFLVVDMNRPEMIPSWDFEWDMVRYSNRDQIDAVVIEGKPVMASGKPVSWDDEKFVGDYTSVAEETVARAKISRLHGPSGQYRQS